MWFERAGEISSGWAQTQCDDFSVLGGGVEGVLQVHEESIAVLAMQVLDVIVQEMDLLW